MCIIKARETLIGQERASVILRLNGRKKEKKISKLKIFFFNLPISRVVKASSKRRRFCGKTKVKRFCQTEKLSEKEKEKRGGGERESEREKEGRNE